MYIDIHTIITAGSALAALGTIVGAIIAVYKTVEKNDRQTKAIAALEEELTIVCYGLKGALEGLIEQGCNGPCRDALDLLNKHLNKSAHKQDI